MPPPEQLLPLPGGATLLVSAAPGIAAFTLERPGQRTRSMALDARPGGPAVTHRWAPWSLQARLWGYGLRGEPQRAFAEALNQLCYRAPDRDEARQQLGAARTALTDALEQVQQGLDGAWVTEANRFAPDARWAVYRALASDGTGRIRQLAQGAPGLFCLALAHARRGDAQGGRAAARFLADVVSGRSLRDASAALLEDWWDHGARRRRWMLHGPQAEVGSAEAKARIAEQLTLLRRAHPSLPLDLLWRPAPLHFVPEDVPTGDALDQRRWFEVMKARTLTLIPYPDAPGLQEGFVRWLSQHAQGIGGRASEQVDALWAWVRATGRQLRRGMNGHRVHRERLAWEFQRNGTRRDGGWDARVRRLAAQHPHLARPQPDGSMDLALPCVFDACDVEGFSLRPFFHASELKREGDEMGHCVASLLEEAVAGNRFLHSLRVGEERLTLELLGPAENLTPGQFLGRQNQPPSDEALAALKAWCDDVNIQANRP